MHPTKFRWKRWVAAALAVLAAYAVLGFWVVPLVITRQVPEFVRSELARKGSVGEVRFNPFTLRLQASDLILAETDGQPLVTLGGFTTQLKWRSLIDRAWTFAEIRFSAPHANLVIAPDGRFNVAELLATWQRRPHEAATDNSMPRMVIERLTLEQGNVELHDRRAGYDNVFSPINFELGHFSTLPQQNDTHTLSARSVHGGTLRWKGSASLNPIRADGELTLDDASLPELAVYLKSYTRATVAAGQLSATLPYAISYADGKFEARLAGAKLSLRDLALSREGASDSFAALTRLEVSGVEADLVRRDATIGELRVDGGKLSVTRNGKGEIDLANLMVAVAGPAAVPAGATPTVSLNDWMLAIRQVVFDQVAIRAVDETVNPPLRLDVGKAQLQLQLAAGQTGAQLQLKVSDAAFALDDLALTSGGRTPFKLAQVGFSDGTLDLAAHRAAVGRLYAQGGQLQLARDRAGKLDALAWLPKFEAPARATGAPATPSAPWTATAKSVELSKFAAEVDDQGTGIKLHVSDAVAKLESASSNLKQPVKFSAALKVREGGEMSAHGTVVPDSGAVQADVQLQQLALAPLQPLLAQHLKLKIGAGSVSAKGRLTLGGGAKAAALRYVGAVNVAGLRLNEQDGDLFAAWKNVAADQITASMAPNRLEVAEVRVVEPNATLIIEQDRSLNAARLLVQPPANAAATKAASAASAPASVDSFPVRIRRVRLQNAKLAFTDLSLQPQFAAKIFDLNGVVTGLSSNRDARSQVELDGRVDEFGLARVRGELNPFAPSNNTDLNVVFKNVDMVPTSPYAMKFAGYKIAEGKISLDLQYKVRQGQLEGNNQIVIDKLTLGERVDAPDALKLPLELAIAILKDSDGRIDLGLPVSGNLNDPQFSYGALIWKALGSLLTKIVTAPFRALGALLGGGSSGERLEAITFDPGSVRLLPPEREKLKQVAQLLSKRPQLKLSVPGQYSEQADGAALRAQAVRTEIARRAGIKLEPGEAAGAIDFGQRAVRSALRSLYAERFGDAELDKQKKAAESAAAAPQAASASAAAAPAALPLFQRIGKMVQGEPQVADATSLLPEPAAAAGAEPAIAARCAAAARVAARQRHRRCARRGGCPAGARGRHAAREGELRSRQAGAAQAGAGGLKARSHRPRQRRDRSCVAPTTLLPFASDARRRQIGGDVGGLRRSDVGRQEAHAAPVSADRAEDRAGRVRAIQDRVGSQCRIDAMAAGAIRGIQHLSVGRRRRRCRAGCRCGRWCRCGRGCRRRGGRRCRRRRRCGCRVRRAAGCRHRRHLALDEVIAGVAKSGRAAGVAEVDSAHFVQLVEHAGLDVRFVLVRGLHFVGVFPVGFRVGCPAAVRCLRKNGNGMRLFAGFFAVPIGAAAGDVVVEHRHLQLQSGLHEAGRVIDAGLFAGSMIRFDLGLHHRRERRDHVVLAGRRAEGVGRLDGTRVGVDRVGTDHRDQLCRADVARGNRERDLSLGVGASLHFARIAQSVVVGVDADQCVLDQPVHDGGGEGRGRRAACAARAATAAAGRERDHGSADQGETELLLGDFHEYPPLGVVENWENFPQNVAVFRGFRQDHVSK